jgi:hypothetical protein
MDNDYYHLMDHRHGRGPISRRSPWAHVGGIVVIALMLVFVLSRLVSGESSGGCQQVTHNGNKVCATYNQNDQVTYVPWAIWTNGGSYGGVRYGANSSGSSYSDDYGFTDGSEDSSSFGTDDSGGDSSDSGDDGD